MVDFTSYGQKCFRPIKLQDSRKCNISKMKTLIKCNFSMQINTEVFCKLLLLFWAYEARHAQSMQNKKFAYLCNTSRKTWGMKLIFCLEMNAKVSYNLVVSLWVCIPRHVQSTQNNIFAEYLQYLKKNVKDKVDFLAADKHQKFLWIVTIILGVARNTQIIQNKKFVFSFQYLIKEVSDEVDFLHTYKHECFLQIDTDWDYMILMGMVSHFQSS